jgi:hypothetical protein
MKKPDQLRERFQMQTALDERLDVKKNEVNFKRLDSGRTKKEEDDSKLV